jgi:hypothetical protein
MVQKFYIPDEIGIKAENDTIWLKLTNKATLTNPLSAYSDGNITTTVNSKLCMKTSSYYILDKTGPITYKNKNYDSLPISEVKLNGQQVNYDEYLCSIPSDIAQRKNMNGTPGKTDGNYEKSDENNETSDTLEGNNGLLDDNNGTIGLENQIIGTNVPEGNNEVEKIIINAINNPNKIKDVEEQMKNLTKLDDTAKTTLINIFINLLIKQKYQTIQSTKNCPKTFDVVTSDVHCRILHRFHENRLRLLHFCKSTKCDLQKIGIGKFYTSEELQNAITSSSNSLLTDAYNDNDEKFKKLKSIIIVHYADFVPKKGGKRKTKKKRLNKKIKKTRKTNK